MELDVVFLATVGGILSMLFWGIGDYISGKGEDNADHTITVFLIQFVAVLIFLPVVFWYGVPFNSLNPYLIVAASAAASTIAYISFVKSLTIGPYGIAAPIGNAYPLVTLIIGVSLLGFQLSLVQLVALVIVVIGVITLAVDVSTFHFKQIPSSTVIYGLIAMFFWGIGFALFQPVVQYFAWYQLLFVNSAFMTFFALTYFMIKKRAFPNFERLRYKNNKFAWQSGIWIALGAVTFFAATEQIGGVAIPAVLASASPLVTSFMAYYRDGEKLTLLKRVGAVVIVLGIVLLNI